MKKSIRVLCLVLALLMVGSLFVGCKDNDTESPTDVESVVAVYETGEIYYSKSEDKDVTLWDFVEDDMAKADAKAEEPVEPEYPEYPGAPLYNNTFWGR